MVLLRRRAGVPAARVRQLEHDRANQAAALLAPGHVLADVSRHPRRGAQLAPGAVSGDRESASARAAPPDGLLPPRPPARPGTRRDRVLAALPLQRLLRPARS